jgi:hypothetical protein
MPIGSRSGVILEGARPEWYDSNVHLNRWEAHMRPEDIRAFLKKMPFEPFRITLTDGRSYDVRHPEMAMVGRSSVLIGLPLVDDPEPVYDRFVTVSLLHIMQVQSLEHAAS